METDRKGAAGRRQHSVTEADVRNAVAGLQSSCSGAEEKIDALRPGHRSGRQMWARVKSTCFRQKLMTASIFLQNDDENERAAKAAIRDVMVGVRLEEIDITPRVKALVSLHIGEMAGLDYRFKNTSSLFRKVMARLDDAIVGSPRASDAVSTVVVVCCSVLLPLLRSSSSA